MEYKLKEFSNILQEENFSEKKCSNILNDLNDRKLKILILGGSQAAKIFAEKLTKIFKECNEAKIPLKIYQQCLPEQNWHCHKPNWL